MPSMFAVFLLLALQSQLLDFRNFVAALPNPSSQVVAMSSAID